MCLYILGLFEVHKLLFSFQMTIRIQEVESGLNRDELDFFIKGNISLEKVYMYTCKCSILLYFPLIRVLDVSLMTGYLIRDGRILLN